MTLAKIFINFKQMQFLTVAKTIHG